MEVAKLFQNASSQVTINIRGTKEEPLFQANQIGRLLGITKIRDSIKDFDEDEKVAGTTGTLGGQQQTLFLTELGLYRLLGQSHPHHDLRSTEIPKLDNVYVNKEVAELAGDAHKVGKAVDPKKRESQLNTGSAQGSRMIYKRPTHNAKVVEDILKVAQRRYHIASIGGWEHYNNNVEHSVDVIDIAATVVDTLASSFEYMKRGALFKKVIANLHAVQEEDEVDDDDTNLKESLEQEVANTRNKLHEFLAMDNDHRSSSSTSQTYSISRVPGSITWVSDFKRAFEDCMSTKLRLDAATLRTFGYRTSRGRDNVCKSCKAIAQARGGRCCDAYDVSNRIKKDVIFES
ncbi:hypothetical protein TSOC_010046, partial [Tetrabaena socialis]